jgi:hypothetical protein
MGSVTTGGKIIREKAASFLMETTPMTQADAWRMMRRQAVPAGIHAPIGNHSFRATGLPPISRPAEHSKKRKPWPRMKARAPRSSTIAPATKSRSIRSSGSRSNRYRFMVTIARQADLAPHAL